MRQRATVEALLPGGRARLSVCRESACSGDCHHCGGCGSQTQILTLEGENLIGAGPGDQVWVESESRVVLTGAFLLYLLPPAAFLGAYLGAGSLGLWRIPLSLLALGLGVLPALLYNRKLRRTPPEYRIVEFFR